MRGLFLGLVLWGACTPELLLEVPKGPVSGGVPLTVRGDFEQLTLHVDGLLLAGGRGPLLSVAWDSRTVDDGEHQIRGTGFLTDRDPVSEVIALETRQGGWDTPTVRFLAPTDGASYEDGDRIDILLEILGEAPLEEVVVTAHGSVLALLPVDGPWELAWEGVTDGEHCLDAQITTTDGHTSADQVCFSVGDGGNVSDMSCEMTTPLDGTTVAGDVNLRMAASAEGGIQEVRFFVDAEPLETIQKAPWSVYWDSRAAVGQEVTLSAKAIAFSGAVCSTSVLVTVTAESPTDFVTEITQPNDGATISDLSSPVPIKAAIGGGSGAAQGTLWVDGQAEATLTAPPWEWRWDASKYAGQSVLIEVIGEEAGTARLSSDQITLTIVDPTQ